MVSTIGLSPCPRLGLGGLQDAICSVPAEAGVALARFNIPVLGRAVVQPIDQLPNRLACYLTGVVIRNITGGPTQQPTGRLVGQQFNSRWPTGSLRGGSEQIFSVFEDVALEPSNLHVLF